MGKAKRNRKPRNRRFMYFEIELGSPVEKAIEQVKARLATTSTSQAFRYALQYSAKHVKDVGYTPPARGNGKPDHVQLEVTGAPGEQIKGYIETLRKQLTVAHRDTTVTNRQVFEVAILFASNHDVG